MRKHARFFLGATLASLALRLFFVFCFPGVVDDSRLYADVAKNWLQHGVYGVTDSGQIVPTLSRLPGYPAFLAAVFAVFGADNFRAVLLIQVLFDLGTCFLVADLARRLLAERAAMAAFLLTGLCPFLANYSAAALTETLEIFFTALALDLALCGLHNLQEKNSSNRLAAWAGCGLSIGACILLRPDGGILLGAVAGYLLLFLVRRVARGRTGAQDSHPGSIARAGARAGVVLLLSALAPLVPWTLRNLHTLHRFEPLAPRYANDSDELVMVGFNRWVKTWLADYVSVEEIYWNVPGDAIDITRLPNRAFDSQPQRQETAQLFADYNRQREITPDLDARFAALAAARIQAAPLRYYLWLPALRIADMWLRPRTELLPPDPRWWDLNDDARWRAVSLIFGLINLMYVGIAASGVWRAREIRGFVLLIFFLVLRSLFLGSLENPEPRYTLESYPVVIVLAAVALHRKPHWTDRKPA
ncbi:MAG: glycosyltransferase family 39 protein [Candidatus Sulfotelmatobacter sp.]